MPRRFLVSFAAALIALQALWSGGAAAAASAGFDEARLLCATLQPSPEARRAARELAAIAGLSEPASPDHGESAVHECAACFAATAAVIAPDAGGVGPGVVKPAGVEIERGVRSGGRGLAGPPLGPRAPPQA